MEKMLYYIREKSSDMRERQIGHNSILWTYHFRLLLCEKFHHFYTGPYNVIVAQHATFGHSCGPRSVD